MHTCKDSSLCTFFDSMGGAAKIPDHVLRMKSEYCKGDRTRCARYIVKQKIFDGFLLPGDHALDMVGRYLMDLKPDDTDKAKQIMGLMVK